jgi:serine/threonine protein kinase
MQEYNEFIERILRLKTQPVPPLLIDCIPQIALMAIVDDLLTNKRRQSRYQKLAPNQAVRVTKMISGLKRTFCVLRAPNGEYRCVLETKSKNDQHLKRAVEKAHGTHKRGKPAWRLDGKKGPQEYISLVKPLHPGVKKINLKNKEVAKKLAEIKTEVALPWTFEKNSGLQQNVLGAVYTNKNGGMISIYSKKGIPLDKMNNHNVKLLESDQNDIAVSLLKTTALLHEHQVAFQDIKPANILLFKKSDGKLKVKLTDPGAAFKPGMDPKIECLATYPYESPEIAFAQGHPQSQYYNYFLETYRKSGSSLAQPFAAVGINNKPRIDAEKYEQVRMLCLKPHIANDMWALGVTLCWLFNNQLPKQIPTDPYFAGFFKNRSNRFTAAQALTMWSNKKNKL